MYKTKLVGNNEENAEGAGNSGADVGKAGNSGGEAFVMTLGDDIISDEPDG